MGDLISRVARLHWNIPFSMEHYKAFLDISEVERPQYNPAGPCLAGGISRHILAPTRSPSSSSSRTARNPVRANNRMAGLINSQRSGLSRKLTQLSHLRCRTACVSCISLSYLKCHRVGITPLLYDLAAFLFRQRDAHSMQHLFQAFPCDHTLAIRARALSKVTLVSCSDFTSGWCNRLHTADAEKNSKTRFKE